MLKRVLVPLDGSLIAKAALEAVTRIVDTTCEITLVNAVHESEILNYPANPITISPEYYPSLEQLEENAKRYLEEVADTLRQRGYRVRTRVTVGDAAASIIHEAVKLESDVIIMSTHGRSGVSRWLFGSVTSRVLSRATCPVIVVPSQQMQHEHEQKLLETNFN